MLPDQVSNPGPLTYESGALPIALRGSADNSCNIIAKEIEVVDIDNDILYKTTTKRTTEASAEANILGKCVSIILEHQKNSKTIFFYFSTKTYVVTPH